MDSQAGNPDSDAAERGEMFAYYDARADSYEEFYRGGGDALPGLAHEYPLDTAACSALVVAHCRGDVLDLACGTGFWLAAYGRDCTSVMLIDQSDAVLERCRSRAASLGLGDAARIVRGDVFEVPLPGAAFDAALVGFFLSHLTDDGIARLFARIRQALRPQAGLAVVDSAWSDARAPFCRRDGFARRTTPDGRAFNIRKRYFTHGELEDLLRVHGFRVHSAYQGNVFVAVAASRVS